MKNQKITLELKPMLGFRLLADNRKSADPCSAKVGGKSKSPVTAKVGSKIGIKPTSSLSAKVGNKQLKHLSFAQPGSKTGVKV